MSEIAYNIQRIQKELPEGVALVAVSKTKSTEEIMQAYRAGQRIFGENKIQEMTAKYESLPKDIQWHMIGHVQTNKVKHMASYVSLIHGVDSFKLLQEIDKQAAKHKRKIECLLQIHIAEEQTKFGLSESELYALIRSEAFLQLKNIQIKGLMGMATFTEDKNRIKSEFLFLKRLYDKLKLLPINGLQIDVLSMGMSGDYPIALECGSNMVRIGSLVFGERSYPTHL